MSAIPENEKQADDLAPVETTHPGEVTDRRVSVVDAVFGQISEDGPNYRDVRIFMTFSLGHSDSV